MRKICLFIIFISCYSIASAQFKIGLSYQMDRHKVNYNHNPALSVFDNIPNNHYGYTIQVDAIWTLTDDFFVYGGLGYSSKDFKPQLIKRIVPMGAIVANVYLAEYDVHNMEIPMGVRWNFVTYEGLTVGLSFEAVPAFTVVSSENYRFVELNRRLSASSDFGTFRSSEWAFYGIRFDSGLDIGYAIDEEFTLFVSLYWSPYDWRYADRANDPRDEEQLLLSQTMQLTNGQQGMRLGLTHTF